VLVKLHAWDGTGDPEGNVVEVIGQSGEHRTEMNAIVIEHGFRTEFSEAVLAEARDIEANHAKTIEEEALRRADFRETLTMTIDPLDAKDFDDALSLRQLPNDEYEVGIHIADVSFFVRPGSALDDEAIRRGTSVYLVDATIPMLPHELSGNVCSLREGEDRLAFAAVFRMNRHGSVLERRFERTVIRSDKRFTYEEAQTVLDTQQGPHVAELNILREIARALRAQRERDGAIDFGDNEVRFELDPQGRPLRVIRKERIETNLLIEEFMLLANREVAKHVTQLAEKVPERGAIFLYRIHDEPKADRIDELATFVRAVGYEFGHAQKKKYTAHDISNLLKQIDGKPEQHLIRTATLRSMAKAIYSTRNIGHFGLAFEYYTHFTSPIRRYPDVLVHRILASHIKGAPITRREFGSIERLCLQASEQEAKAVDAERDSIRYKQVEYMQSKVGQTFEGVISGVTEWGLYVEEKESAAEGLVRVRTLGGDFYTYNQKAYALVGERSKKKYTLGDKVRVRLTAADLSARTLDFELALPA
jgi:ribonuclease R